MIEIKEYKPGDLIKAQGKKKKFADTKCFGLIKDDKVLAIYPTKEKAEEYKIYWEAEV